MVAKLKPPQSRAQEEAFVQACSVAGLQARLPLPWPTPPETPACPKRRYRSHYVPPSGDELTELTPWDELSDFDLLLRLVNFEGLRPVLAQRLGWTSARGQVPFDPVSLFLLLGWQTITTAGAAARPCKNCAIPATRTMPAGLALAAVTGRPRAEYVIS